MTAMIRHAALPAGVRPPVMPTSATPVARTLTYAVRLLDRRTGQSHRINGTPLVLYTRTPADAVAELLEGRDPAVWDVRVEAIGGAGR